MKRPQLNKIIALLEPVVQELGFIVRDVNWRAGERSLCIFIERAEGQVDLADCEKVSRHISELNLLDPMIADSYLLEVSSPGMEPPLRTKEHFEKVLGKEIEWMDAAKKKSSGVLEKIFSESPLIVNVQTKNGYSKALDVDSLLYAKLKFDWDKLGEAR